MIRQGLRAAGGGLLLLALGACASVADHGDGTASYRYSAFDFSGDSFARQKRRCEALSMKPRHLGTDCGFWTCSSRYRCEPKAEAVQSSVAQ